MTAIDELAAALLAIAEALGRLNVAWAVGGSVASAAHGEPRATNDIDVIAALTEAQGAPSERAPTRAADLPIFVIRIAPGPTPPRCKDIVSSG